MLEPHKPRQDFEIQGGILSVIRIGLTNIDSVKNRLSKLQDQTLEVGWFEGTSYKDGTPVAGVAAVQEFGSPSMGIPPNSFFRGTIAEKQEEWAKNFNLFYKQYFMGDRTSEQVLNLVGAVVVGDVKTTISEINTPLSPVTIALRRLKDDGKKITGSTVGAVASAIAAGKTGPGELGDQSYQNKKRLVDTGYMLATLTYNVKT